MKKQITIEIPDGKKAEWVNGVLTLVDETPKDITERIKTFEDAYNWCAENGCVALTTAYDNVDVVVSDKEKDVIAYMKLRIIVAALNEGWTPKFTTDEYHYYPYFYLYTQKEIDKMDDEQKKRLWLFGGRSSYGSYCGLAYASSNDGWSSSDSYFSARLALKNGDLATYCGKQFVEIWADYVTLGKQSD